MTIEELENKILYLEKKQKEIDEHLKILKKMIKVLEHGVKKITCPHCKAKLQYEQEDIISEKRPNGKRWIICPDCNNEVIINKGDYATSNKSLDFVDML